MDYIVVFGNGKQDSYIFKLTKEEAQACISNSPGAPANLDIAKYIDGSKLSSNITSLASNGNVLDGWYIIKGDPAVLVPSAYKLE